MDEYVKWLDIAEELARRHHNDWALAEHLWVRAGVLFFRGTNLEAEQASLDEARSLLKRVGDAKRVNWVQVDSGLHSLVHGKPCQAETILRRALTQQFEIIDEVVTDVLSTLAASCLAQRRWAAAW